MMIQSQKNNLLGQGRNRNPLLQRYPLLAPLVLFMSSITLGISSLFTETLFPILAFFGIPSALICRLFAVVLGLCAVIVSITGLLDRFDAHQPRQTFLTHTPHPKESHHDCK